MTRLYPHLRVLILALLVPFTLAACEGPVGPPGPAGPAGATGQQGPQGPAGPSGPGTRLTHVGVLDAEGFGGVQLPAAAGSISNPPLMNCYIADQNWYWYVVNTDVANNITCALVEDAGILYAILDAPSLAGWRFSIVVVY